MERKDLVSLEKIPGTLGFLKNIARTDGSLEFDWNIPDFFSREKEFYYKMQCPQFELLDAKWIIKVILLRTDYCIEILCKMKDGYSDFHANYSIEIKCFDSTVYNYVRGTIIVRPVVGAATTKKISSQSALQRDKAKIAPHGVLTIFCSLSAQQAYCEKTTADSATQTEICQGIFKLGKNLQELLTSEEDSDVVMKVGDKDFRAHRAILRARSKVFASMFRHDMKERSCGSVEIADCDPQAFKQFLLYIYTGKVDCLSTENACQLYQVADKYDIQDLKTECFEYIKKNLSTDAFCDVISLALRHKESELIETATQFFVKNSKKIVTTVNWFCFMRENPVEANELTIKMLNFLVPD